MSREEKIERLPSLRQLRRYLIPIAELDHEIAADRPAILQLDNQHSMERK